MLIHNKDDIEFVTEFPCFLGHPVVEHADLNKSWVLYLTVKMSTKGEKCSYKPSQNITRHMYSLVAKQYIYLYFHPEIIIQISRDETSSLFYSNQRANVMGLIFVEGKEMMEQNQLWMRCLYLCNLALLHFSKLYILSKLYISVCTCKSKHPK